MKMIAGPYNVIDGSVPEINGAPVEPWSEPAAFARLQRVAPRVPVTIPPDATLLQGNSNDAWLLDHEVLRVCWRGDRQRLLREARLAAVLPPAIPYPQIRAAGGDETMTWLLADRVDGISLDTVAGQSGPAALRGIMRQLASLLRNLHTWTPPPNIRALLQSAAVDPLDEPLAIVGRSVVPLPVSRLRRLVPLAKTLPFVDGGLLDAADAVISDLADALALDATPAVLVHGDADFSNVLVRDGAIVALLDFEWASFGPRDLDLVPFLAAQARRDPGLPGPPFLTWLREDYPELFADPNLDRRLRLYLIAYNLRGVIVWPPDRAEPNLVHHHPLRRLRSLVTSPDDETARRAGRLTGRANVPGQ